MGWWNRFGLSEENVARGAGEPFAGPPVTPVPPPRP